MKLSFTIFVVLFSFLNQDSYSQKISFQIKGEYNYFSMNDLKDIQKEMLNEFHFINIPLSSVESYPPYYGIQFRLGLTNINNLNYGIMVDLSSTGGRIHYRDYSGEIRIDNILSIISSGVFLEKKHFLNEWISIAYGISGQVIFAKLELLHLTRIGNGNMQQNLTFDCTSYGVEPNVSLTLNRYSFSLGFNLGYLAAESAQYKSNKDARLHKANGNPVNLDMNCFRIGLILGYTI